MLKEVCRILGIDVSRVLAASFVLENHLSLGAFVFRLGKA